MTITAYERSLINSGLGRPASKTISDNVITPFANLAAFPADFVGMAKALDTHKIYKVNNTAIHEVLETDANGDIVANIIPRTDTLANLMQIVGTAGELASSTDTPAIVQFNGVSAPGTVFYANPGATSANMPTFVRHNVNCNITLNGGYALPGTGLIPQNPAVGLPVISSVTQTATSTYMLEGLNILKGPTAPSAYSASAGGIVSTGQDWAWIGDDGVTVSTSKYCTISPTNSAGWVSYTTQPTDTTHSYTKPIRISANYALATSSASASTSYVYKLGSDSAYNLAMPSTAVWAKPVGPDWFYFNSTRGFAISYVVGTTTGALLTGVEGTQVWSSITMPASMLSTHRFAFTDTSIIMFIANNNTYYVATYDRENGVIGAWQAKSTPGYGIVTIMASIKKFYLMDNKAAAPGAVAPWIYQSSDGIAWAKITTGTVSASSLMYPFDGGVFVYASVLSASIWFVVTDSGIYVPPFIPMAINQKITPVPGGIYNFNTGRGSRIYSTTPQPTFEIMDFYIQASTSVILEYKQNFVHIYTAGGATLDVRLPLTPYGGQECTISIQNAFTTVTFTAGYVPTLTTFNNQAATYSYVTTTTGQTTFKFVYNIALNTWIKI